MEWKDDQRRVIEQSGTNLLVSASAGSGKTAVLVERVFHRIMRPPVHIDELLILTFTRAAAAELRERIGARIEAGIENGEGDAAHLRRQKRLLHRAQITTIDGFCSYVIRSYAGESELEPGFRVMEDAESRLLRRDTAKELLEACHLDGDPAFAEAFADFAQNFTNGRSEDALIDLILRMYDAAVSRPYPERFLDDCRKQLQTSGGGGALFSRESDFRREVRELAERGLASAETAERAVWSGAPNSYRDVPAAYRAFFDGLLRMETDVGGDGGAEDGAGAAGDESGAWYDRAFGYLSAFSAPSTPRRSSSGKDPAVDAGKNAIAARCAACKALLETLKNEYFFASSAVLSRFGETEAEQCAMLIGLTERFLKAFREKKAALNAVDFSDQEHGALSVLRDAEGRRTQCARDLAGRFREVMVDEYQDSNLLQEAILTAVSRIDDGAANYFCVGDVKQSIYRFRQADPTLFLEKFQQYADGKAGVRIDLQDNFRSALPVLSVVNAVFSAAMRREAGGVEYDEPAQLRQGRVVPPLEEDGREPSVEAYLTIDESRSSAISREAREAEAAAVAERMAELLRGGRIVSETDGVRTERPVRCGDMVVLIRSLADAELFQRVLSEHGIPAYTVSRTGYFSTLEVQTVLAFLSVVDNPRQDIPYAASLRQVEDLGAEDLAQIRLFGAESGAQGPACGAEGGTEDGAGEEMPDRSVSFSDRVRAYAAAGPDPALREKTAHFVKLFDSFRASEGEIPLHELITRILDETGYGLYLRSLPGGARRYANVRMLIERAYDFGQTSYTGLFHFNRYISQLQKASVDFGEAPTEGEGSDVVRILTIHGSKGLQYPVVFLPQLDRRFNQKDLSETVLIHPKLGCAMRVTDRTSHVRAETVRYRYLRRKLKAEETGEELRVLYVAMTRAEQKLILSGSVKRNHLTELEKDPGAPFSDDGRLSAERILGASSYLDLLLPLFLKFDREKALPFDLRYGTPQEAVQRTDLRKIRQADEVKALLRQNPDETVDPGMKELLERRFSYEYPYRGEDRIPVKLSVSELKHAAMQPAEDDGKNAFEMPDVIPLVPEFRKEKSGGLTGSDRGTAYHTLLSNLDFAALSDAANDAAVIRAIDAAKADLAARGILTEEQAEAVVTADIAAFAGSREGRRMAAAQRDGALFLEQPFTMQVPASEADPSWPETEKILIQGIIDVFFEEDDGLILLDYKTDRVKSGQELISRYRTQLDLYAEALTKATGKPVREKLIYSFALRQTIPLD